MSSSSRKNLPENELAVVSGYVHDVLDVLVGKQGGRYFDFKVQESSEVFTRIACFSPDKRNALKNSNESKSAVRLLNLSPSKRSYDPDKKEYRMNKYSKVTDGQTLSFPWKSPPQTNNFVSVGDILAGVASANGEVVSVMVRVSFVSTVENVFSSTMKRQLRKYDIVVVDENAIRLTVWEELIEQIEVGKSYIFSNVKAGFFKSLFLNTTKKTTVTVLEEGIELSAEAIGKAEECQQSIVRPGKFRQLEGEILCAEATHSLVCCNCNSHMQVPAGKEFVKCSSCGVTCLKRKLSTYITAKLMVEDADGNWQRYHCPMAVLRSFFSLLATSEGSGIKESDVTKLSDDMIAETLLQCGKIKFEVNEEDKKIESMDYNVLQ